MSDVSLRWVLPEPNRERAVDALGTGAFAEALADQLVPGFSGATRRARYISLLCAAVRSASSSTSPNRAIHRIEAEHAVLEAEFHDDEGAAAECPDVVGRQRAAAELKLLKGEWPTRPERLYKNTAFDQYRSLMRSLGFLDRTAPAKLTEHGERLAKVYPLRKGAEWRCLSAMPAAERVPVASALGIVYKTKPRTGTPQALRRETYEHLWSWRGDRNGASLLVANAQPRARPTRVSTLLHRAFVWELISLGLLAALVLLLRKQRVLAAAKELNHALSGKPRIPDLRLALGRDEVASQCVALLRRGVALRAALPPSCGSHVDLATGFVTGTTTAADFLRGVARQHQLAKGGDAWFRLDGEHVQQLALGKNMDFRLVARDYRISAFAQFLSDLRYL